MSVLSGVLSGASRKRVQSAFASGALQAPDKPASKVSIPKWADNVEVNGIAFISDDFGDNEVEATDSDPDAWSVYFHRDTGGVSALYDFPTAKAANAYARTLVSRMKKSGQLQYEPIYAAE